MDALRAHIVEEFAVSQRIVRSGNDVMPRFKIFAPDGEHVAFLTLPEDIGGRLERLEVMRAFMIWKAATGFVMSSELAEPNALLVVAVTRFDVVAALQPISRKPKPPIFAKLQWLDRDRIDDNILGLLPPKSLSVTTDQIEFMRRAFEEGEIEGITWQRPPG